jgi:hypothetical protein
MLLHPRSIYKTNRVAPETGDIVRARPTKGTFTSHAGVSDMPNMSIPSPQEPMVSWKNPPIFIGY